MSTDNRRSRPGGRSADVKRRVFDVIKRAMREQDWSTLAISDIAELVGVNKTTIYRRWNNKERLIADLLDSISDAYPSPPDTGDVVLELTLVSEYLARFFETPFGRSLVTASVASSEPALESAVRRYWADLLGKVAWVVRRAINRGELSTDTDPAEVVESMIAPIYLRVVVTGEGVDREAIGRIVRRVLAPKLVSA